MGLKIYNTLTRTKEDFVTLEPGKVRMYVCGMTVYDYCHVGHARVLVVFDAVYNPRRTRLLREAAGAGCRTIEGIEMFLGQAYVQFELWTGQRAPRDVMRRVLEEKL